MSTALLFAHPKSQEDIERERDVLQLRNAQLVLLLQEVQKWLKKSAFRGKESDRIRKRIEEALR